MPFRPPPQARPLPPFHKNPTYQQQPIAPIHLSAAVQLQPGASSGVSSNALMNPMGQDMELLEMKFMVSTTLSTSTLLPQPFGGSIGVDLSLGNFKLTNGSVPVWGLGRAENLAVETVAGFYDAVVTNWFVACIYSWRLPRPMFVPAGAVVAPKFSHFGYVPNTLTVRVGYSARSVVKSPRVSYIPWASTYSSKVFNPITTASSDVSQEKNLLNDTGRTFNLQRFTGRTQFTSQAGTAYEADPATFATRYLTLRMSDSYGRPLVRNYVPFRSVFGDITRSWELEEVGAQLDPGAYYRVLLKKATMTMAGSQSLGQAQAFVTMVGWREEPL